MQHIFDTPAPTSVYVEIGSGDVTVGAEEVTRTVIDVDGTYADEVVVEQRGDQIVVIAPHRHVGFFGGDRELQVRATVPLGSELASKLGSADVAATGRLGAAKVRTGSGNVYLHEVTDQALVETGSGDVTIGTAETVLRVKTGSGDVEVAGIGEGSISTGSGDVEIGVAAGAVQVKSGSGDLRVREVRHGVELGTASGDVFVDRAYRGQVFLKNVSGDIHVGIPAGVPVWTDISSVTGSVSSTLAGAGAPTEGQDYVELRAKTVSGDVHLEQL